jgi:hypothetical protein
VLAQFFEGQVEWLTTFQYRLDNIRRKERAGENLSDVTLRQSGMSG